MRRGRAHALAAATPMRLLATDDQIEARVPVATWVYGAFMPTGADDRDPERMRDPKLQLWAFMSEILVRCPACDGLAAVRTRPAESPPTSRATNVFGPRRRTCTRCLATQTFTPRSATTYRDGLEPHSGLTLWLRAPCCGATLWAYNRDHLLLIRDWVAADHRERTSPPPGDGFRGDRWEAATLLERLPSWMTAAKHRGRVLRTAENLLATLPPS